MKETNTHRQRQQCLCPSHRSSAVALAPEHKRPAAGVRAQGYGRRRNRDYLAEVGRHNIHRRIRVQDSVLHTRVRVHTPRRRTLRRILDAEEGSRPTDRVAVLPGYSTPGRRRSLGSGAEAQVKNPILGSPGLVAEGLGAVRSYCSEAGEQVRVGASRTSAVDFRGYSRRT